MIIMVHKWENFLGSMSAQTELQKARDIYYSSNIKDTLPPKNVNKYFHIFFFFKISE